MKTVPAKELSTMAMVGGNESKYNIIIDGDTVKQWIGFGWVDLRKASSQDREKYPSVKRS